jgi:hypothetical protein
MTLKAALAAPFYHSRAQKLEKSELIYYYVFERRWMDKDKVDLLIRRGLEQHMLGSEKGMFFPLFDLSDVHIPIGYKPSSSIFEVSDPFEHLLERISSQTGKENEEIVGVMNQYILEGFNGNLRPEAGLVLVAKNFGVPVNDLLDSMREKLLKKE